MRLHITRSSNLTPASNVRDYLLRMLAAACVMVALPSWAASAVAPVYGNSIIGQAGATPQPGPAGKVEAPYARSARQAASDAAAQFDPEKFGRLTTETLPIENGERIVMRVNDIPVTWEDFLIQIRLAGASLFAQHAGKEEGIMAALAPAMDDPLILQALYRNFARKHSLVIQKREIDSRINTALSDNNPVAREALRQLTPDQLRIFVKDNLIREKVEKFIGDRATSVSASAEEVARFVESAHPTTASAQLTRARHIVFRATPDMSEFNINDAEAKAKEVLEKIRGGLDFVTAARQYSQDRFTAYLGGDIGYFKPGSMYDKFEEVAKALEPGEVSGIVRTPVGFHIIQVTERRSDDLMLKLDAHRRQLAIESWKRKAGDSARMEKYLGVE